MIAAAQLRWWMLVSRTKMGCSRYLLAVTAALLLGPSGTALAAPGVAVFPSPGTHVALPGTQIAFRGVPAAGIGSITVVGSRSGTHSGRIQADSDGHGGSFLPDRPFVDGEQVTVHTRLKIIGSSHGTFRFTIARLWGPIGAEHIPLVGAGSTGVLHYHSRPDLVPATVKVTTNRAPASLGDVFVAPQQGPVQNGPELLDPSGVLIWFKPLPKDWLATDFRVQRLFGHTVLTWWQGTTNRGSGRGEGVIYDRHYRQIYVVKTANGLQGVDLHEFLITPQGQAYIIAALPLRWGSSHGPFMDSVVQEIDIRTGLLLFEWHAYDHIPLSESFFKPKSTHSYVYDPYHLNSISIAHDGNLVISSRNTWASYKVDRHTGRVLWTLGSNKGSFKMGPGTRTAFQHDVLVQPDGTLTEFDDGAGPPQIENQARGIRISIDTKAKTTKLLAEYKHLPSIVSWFEGSMQVLSGGDLFLGYGSAPNFSGFDSGGRLDYDAHFNAPTNSYRAYRFPWSAQPPTTPAVALTRGADGVSTIYASWNGATDVSSWRVLAGPRPGALSQIGIEPKRLFETAIQAHTEQSYVAMEPLSASGHTLARSQTVGSSSTRVSIFGHSAFISGGGGGLFVGCFSSHTCHIGTTVTAGNTVIATTGPEHVDANSAAYVFFSLSSNGRSMLSRSSGHQLAVTATVRNVDGASNSSNLNLLPYSTTGSPPAYSVQHAPAITIFGRSAFVSPSGVGGLFVGCHASDPCHLKTTVTSGSTVIAQTAGAFVGADDFANLLFTLTSTGNSLLSHTHGNQLPVKITVSGEGQTASAQMSLVRFG